MMSKFYSQAQQDNYFYVLSRDLINEIDFDDLLFTLGDKLEQLLKETWKEAYDAGYAEGFDDGQDEGLL